MMKLKRNETFNGVTGIQGYDVIGADGERQRGVRVTKYAPELRSSLNEGRGIVVKGSTSGIFDQAWTRRFDTLRATSVWLNLNRPGGIR